MILRGLRCALALAATVACAGTPLPPVQSGPPDTVVLISIPGMTAAELGPDGSSPRMPRVAALAEAGAFAEAVEGVVPASHYPTHATLLTGHVPSLHGIVSDHPLGRYGVRATRHAHASALRVPTLWQRVQAAGGSVAALDWPTTQGAEIRWLVPDVPPLRRGQTWLEALIDGTTPPLRGRLAIHGAMHPDASRHGPARDAALVKVACEVLASNPQPDLMLLHLGQTQEAWRAGPGSRAAAAAFAAADAEVETLIDCLAARERLAGAAIVLVGGHAPAPVHTGVAPNVVLAARGLRAAHRDPQWQALVRSNGGTAFVYARSERAAIAARIALRSEAERSGAFRVIAAEEMIEAKADPEAWFGLEALPGFHFVDAADGTLLRVADGRGASGYLPGGHDAPAVFVAWGRGVRAGLPIARMRQTDVAPTLARLLGVELDTSDGRALVGVLDLEPSVAAGADGGSAGE